MLFNHYEVLCAVSSLQGIVAGLAEAIRLAESLCKFPQECMLMDRRSAHHSTFNSKTLESAFKYEWDNAKHVLFKESIKGKKIKKY